MNVQQPKLRFSRTAVLALSLACIGLPACTTTGPHDHGNYSANRTSIDANVDSTLARLYDAAPASRDMVSRAAGVLVFPSVLDVGFVVGAEHGKGALRVNGVTVDYYSASGGSIGLQAGAQTKAEVVLFMTQESLDKFRNSHGWTAGADATVAIANIGANGSLDTDTVRRPIVGFVMTNSGLMAGVSLEGSKFSKL
jgi:lipid-binding SYLF domain-containing protein